LNQPVAKYRMEMELTVLQLSTKVMPKYARGDFSAIFTPNRDILTRGSRATRFARHGLSLILHTASHSDVMRS
jgi:hypothetical protein